MKFKKIITSILLLGVCTTTLVGCGNNGGQSTTDTGAVTTGEKVFNISALKGGNLDTKFDHLWVNRGDLYKVLTFRSLFLADNTLTKVEPDLASGYEISEDGLTYTITMKDGLKWSDGQALTADDVEFSISTLLKAAMSNGIYTSAFNKIEGASEWKDGSADKLAGLTVDGNVITIKTTEKVGNMINVLAQFAIYPKHCLENVDPLQIHNDVFWENPVTSGMYKIGELNAGNYIVLERNEHYEGQQPNIDKVVVNIVADNITAAQSGQTDYLNTNSTGDVNQLSTLSNFTAYPVDTLFYRYFIVNYKDAEGNVNEKLADPKVREALLYAIDREALATSLYPELAEVNDAGVPKNYEGFNSSVTHYEYNPEKAKELLKEANFDFSQTLKIRYYYADQTSVDFVNAIAQYLSNVGITVDALKFQGDATTEIYTVRDHDIVLKGLSAFGFEEFYSEYTSSNANFVNIYGKESKFDELYDQLASETDQAKRVEILEELQTLEQEEILKLPMFTLKNLIYVNTDKVDVKGEFGNPWYAYDLNFEEWDIK